MGVKALHYLEYAGFRFLETLAVLLPDAGAERIGGALGRFYYRIAPGRRRTARENAARAFPEWKPADVEKMVRANFAHLGVVALEFLRTSRLTPEEMRRRVRVEGLEVLEEARARGRGVLMLGIHAGNWEFAGMAMAVRGYSFHAIGRRLSNPLVDKRVLALRGRFGGRIIGHRNAVRPVFKALREGGCVGVLLDQRARLREGLASRFFGRPVWTNQGLALLALKSGAPVIFGRDERTPEGHVLRFGPIIDPPAGAEREEAVRKFTEAFDREIENGVRARPEQWFWMHKRWELPKGAQEAAD